MSMWAQSALIIINNIILVPGSTKLLFIKPDAKVNGAQYCAISLVRTFCREPSKPSAFCSIAGESFAFQQDSAFTHWAHDSAVLAHMHLLSSHRGYGYSTTQTLLWSTMKSAVWRTDESIIPGSSVNHLKQRLVEELHRFHHQNHQVSCSTVACFDCVHAFLKMTANVSTCEYCDLWTTSHLGNLHFYGTVHIWKRLYLRNYARKTVEIYTTCLINCCCDEKDTR